MFRSAARRGWLLVLLGALAFAIAACTSAPGGTASVVDSRVEVAATGADFDVSTIEAKAGQPFTVRFTNNDPVSHDFAVYTDEGGDLIVRSDLIKGPGATTEVQVPALEPGTYFFRCGPHADHMTGALVVGD